MTLSSSLEEQIVEIVGEDPKGVTTERICKLLRCTPQELGDVFERLIARNLVIGFAGLWISPRGLKTGTDLFLEALAKLHEVSPAEAQMDPIRVVQAAGLTWSGKPLDRILARLAQSGAVESNAKGIHLTHFVLELSDRQKLLLQRVIEVITSEPISTPSPQSIAQHLGIPRQAIEEILRLGIRSGQIVQIADVVYYTPAQMSAIRERLLATVQDRPFTSTELRDALGTTRKYILPILDYCDSIGLTVKRGQQRVVLSGSTTTEREVLPLT